MPVRCELHKIILFEQQEQQTIVLKETDGARKFPIVISMEVASAIHRRLNGTTFPRPLTHDLLASVIQSLGATVERIDILDLRDSTFFASIVLNLNGKLVAVDSRPSDAIALSVNMNTPIFVAEHVLDKVCGKAV
jgi:uncharacterized protein